MLSEAAIRLRCSSCAVVLDQHEAERGAACDACATPPTEMERAWAARVLGGDTRPGEVLGVTLDWRELADGRAEGVGRLGSLVLALVYRCGELRPWVLTLYTKGTQDTLHYTWSSDGDTWTQAVEALRTQIGRVLEAAELLDLTRAS